MFLPQRHSELMDFSLSSFSSRSLILRLISPNRNLTIPITTQTPLINIRRTNNNINIIHNHHLRMNINTKSSTFRQCFVFCLFLWQRRRIRNLGFRSLDCFSVSKTIEVQIICDDRDISTYSICFSDGFKDCSVHHLLCSSLPFKNLLRSSIFHQSFRVHWNHNVHIKLFLLSNFTANLVCNFKRNQILAPCMFVLMPILTRTQKILIF
mmetsp:Transcript_14001/g.19347  ORF Transcript_14001/g.19347 Transcript_14001/m.19347 type:complete len:209 (-) Transcript_14001:1638-2264(-)